MAAILDLQSANFIGNLAPSERQAGFLSIECSLAQLEAMAADVGIIVACEDGRLAGYLCASSCEFNRQFPLLARMIEQFGRMSVRSRLLACSRVFIYGPVCIDRPYRGRGVLGGLYQTLKNTVAGRFDVGVAFVAKENAHSLRAHVEQLTMEHVGDFGYSGKDYHILAFEVPARNPGFAG